MRAVLLGALLAALGSPLTAQTPPPLSEDETPTGPLILRLQASTRAVSMGGTYMITSPDADAIFYNPQLLSVARGFSISAQRYGSAATLTTFAAAMDANVGFGIQLLDYQMPLVNVPEAIGSHVALSHEGGMAGSEAVMTLGYARSIKGVRLGVAGKWAHHWSGNYSEGAAGVDLGSSINPLAWLSVALSVQNLGGSFSLGPAEYELPMMGTLLVTQRPRVVGPLDVSLSGRFSMGPDVDAFGGLGADVSYWPFSGLTFAARAGVRFGTESFAYVENLPPLPGIPTVIDESAFTAGGGVTWRRVTLDYAWEPFENADDAHRIGLRIR